MEQNHSARDGVRCCRCLRWKSLAWIIVYLTYRLITGGRDGCIRIWNYNNGHCLRTMMKGERERL